MTSPTSPSAWQLMIWIAFVERMEFPHLPLRGVLSRKRER
jgi:hypothetical protein